MQTFDLKQLRLLDGPCKDAQESCRRYLHALDSDRMLRNYRVNAGLDAPGEPLGGWERPDIEVRGNFVAHYLTACALMYAAVGDKELKAKADSIVAELAKCQAALGGGYLMAFPNTFFDRLESMENVPWASYYIVHKMMAGLLDMYTICSNKQALQVLEGMVGYFAGRMAKLSGHRIDQILTVEHGGIIETLYDAYAVTGDKKYLDLGRKYEYSAFLGPLAIEHDNLTKLHANTHIPIICGAARYYEITGDERYRAIVRYFWDRAVTHRTYATGGCTVHERWPEPDKLADTLNWNNQECCKTYNLLRVTRYLMRWTADPAYADFYERAFVNGILGTQDVESGQMMYYVPLATGYAKWFGSPNDTFWCCYGTGVESFAKLADSIYFHDDEGLYVNLFIASELNWTERGVRVEQLTGFPNEERTSLVIHTSKPQEMPIHIHIPYWAKRGVKIRVNGEKQDVAAKPTSYATIERTWSDGDRVEVDLPMSLHLQAMPDDPNLAAIMYGPLVLAGILDPGEGHETRFTDDKQDKFAKTDYTEPIRLTGPMDNLDSWIKPTGAPVTFTTTGQETAITLIPLNRVANQRYGVYWRMG